MAKAAGDAGLWVLGDKDNNNDNGVNADSFGFPSEFPYEFDSLGVSSPVESLAGSTETESSDGEVDFFAALTRRLSQSSLHDSRKHHHQLTPPITTTTASDKPQGHNHKTRVLYGSPQSTLSGIGSWSGDRSPNGSSRTTPFGDNDDPWDVIYAAAGQVARLKYMSGETSSFGFQNRGLLGNGLPHATLFSNQASQCGSVWGRQAKPNWLVQDQKRGYESVKCERPVSLLPQSAWPPLQVQQPQNQRVPYSGSRSRPGSGVKRGCGGTGVFLPRHYGNNPSESRKITGCAPVLVPAKVVHALNLNIDDPNVTSQPRFSGAFATDYDALLARRKALLIQQRLSLRREEAANYEIRLPQEWTY